MAIESPESIDLEAQRAELETVLRSEHFTRAPMLARLLSYLCEGLFAGEAGQIKEYTVGVEVFHRGASFDQNSDSIVRVEANRLRKRLAEYYAGAGASHRLRIVIPLGQYVPEFESAAPPPEEEPPPPAEPPAPERIAMELMRHSDRRLTDKAYTDSQLLQTCSSIEALPSYTQPPSQLASQFAVANGLSESAAKSFSRPS